MFGYKQVDVLTLDFSMLTNQYSLRARILVSSRMHALNVYRLDALLPSKVSYHSNLTTLHQNINNDQHQHQGDPVVL